MQRALSSSHAFQSSPSNGSLFRKEYQILGQPILKLTFYLITGVVLSSITWSTLSHSSVTDDYVISIVLLAMMFYVAGQFCIDRWRPAADARDFHPTRLWKMPYQTDIGGLWLRVAFSTIVNMAIYAILASLLVLTTTAQPAFMVLLGILFLLRIPHLYWSIRGRYIRIDSSDDAGATRTILRYESGSGIHRNAQWLIPIGMAGAGAALATIGMVFRIVQ